MATAKTKSEEASHEEYLNELVTVRVPRLAGSTRQDLFVGVNGRTWLIQRGRDVQVPRFVAEVIEQSISQREKVDDMIDRMQDDADKRFARI